MEKDPLLPPGEQNGVESATHSASQVWAEVGAHALLYESGLAAYDSARMDAGARAAGFIPAPIFYEAAAQNAPVMDTYSASPLSGPYEAGQGGFSVEASAVGEAGQGEMGGSMEGGAAGLEGGGGGLEGGGGEAGAE